MLNGILWTAPFLAAMAGQIGDAAKDPSREDVGRVTLGGMQYWTDHLVCQGWRIQQHVKFGQFRLLKPTNRVAQSGTYSNCRRTFDSVRNRSDVKPISSTVLVTVHGLGRTRNSMSGIGKHVSEQTGFGWINFSYASTRGTITDHARALRNTLNELASLKLEQDAKIASDASRQGGIEYHFIAHSLGNIVIRCMLCDIEREKNEPPQSAWRVGRMIMLGPPNQGSAMANLLRNSKTFDLLAGPSGKLLGAEWNELQERLITPPLEFAVIAGGKGDEKGYNPFLAGDDDLIVRVEETKLSGAADFAVVPSIHTQLMDHSESKKMASRFLQSGFLNTVGKRTPIP